MGHAAHMRGSAAIRRGLDEQARAADRRIDRSGVPLRWEDERAELQARAEAAERDLGRAKLRLRLLSATLTAEREAAEIFKRRAREAWRSMADYKQRWQWVSCLVRRHVSPEQVAEFRAEQEDHDHGNKED